MGFLDVQRLSYALPDGRLLFDEVAFRVGDGTKTALVGANGTGKTTLLRIVAGDLVPTGGGVVVDGGLGVMRQSIGSLGDGAPRSATCCSTSRRPRCATRAGRSPTPSWP